jgi:putative sterol carrier protein
VTHTYGTAEWEQAYRELVERRLAESEKPYIMGTPEWVATYEKLIQEDAPYKEAAKTWEGSVVIHILARPESGLERDIYLFMDLWHGDCRFVRLFPPEAGEKGDFVLTGELERWEAVMSGELDTIKAMMQGKIKLKGHLPTIVRAVKAATRLVELSGQIETKYISQLNEAEIDSLKYILAEAGAQFGI